MSWSNRFNPIGDGHVITSHADMASEHFRTKTSRRLADQCRPPLARGKMACQPARGPGASGAPPPSNGVSKTELRCRAEYDQFSGAPTMLHDGVLSWPQRDPRIAAGAIPMRNTETVCSGTWISEQVEQRRVSS
jgi:hypothetical protein